MMSYKKSGEGVPYMPDWKKVVVNAKGELSLGWKSGVRISLLTLAQV